MLIIIGRIENLTARLEQQEKKMIASSHTDSRSIQIALLGLLRTDTDSAERDLERVLRQSQSFDIRSQGRVQWALQTPRFQQWLQSKHSDALLINGNTDDGLARCSPMSMLSAMLIRSLEQAGGVFVSHFSCGSHNSSGDPLSGPTGMLRSLNAQFLSTRQFDTGFLRTSRAYEELRTHDLDALHRLLRILLGQLPNIVVFCIIDGISLFESERWRNETATVVRRLQHISSDETLECRFKLLFTTPTISRCANEVLRRENILSIPADAGNGRLLTDRSIRSDLSLQRSRSAEDRTELEVAHARSDLQRSEYDFGCE